MLIEGLSLPVSERRMLALLFALLVGLPALFGLGIRTAETQSTSPSPAQTTTYEVEDLGTLLNHAVSEANGINDDGQVVGYSLRDPWVSDSYPQAFLKEPGKEMQDLDTLGGQLSEATAINGSGQVVGHSANSSGINRAFLKEPGEAMTDFFGPLLDGEASGANDINDSGAVVGSYYSDGRSLAFFKEAGSQQMQDLGALLDGEESSEANGINDSGAIVGSYYSDGRSLAFLKEAGSQQMQDLGHLGGQSSKAKGINATGQVIGYSDDSENNERAFLKEPGKEMQDLGALGGNESEANGINDSGQVVGQAEWLDSDDRVLRRAFLYENGEMTNLNDLIPADSGWTISEATAINNNGQIAANGYKSGDDGGHALLLTPKSTTTPSTPDLEEQSDTGASSTDDLTNDDTPTFTGTADKGSTVKIYVDGVEKGSATAKEEGTYSVTTSTPLGSGSYSITAKAFKGSVESDASQALSITIDRTPPTLVGLPAQSIDLKATGPRGAVATFTVTATDTVDGNDVAVTCDPASGSTFPVGDPTMVTCLATDEAGNPAEGSFNVTVTQTESALDIKPQTCPNALSTSASGSYPVAIVGTGDLDVSQIDTTKPIKLEGVLAQTLRKGAIKDVATPYTGTISNPPQSGQCTKVGADGKQDLNLKFDAQQVIKALGTVTNKEARVVKLEAYLKDGTYVIGEDVIVTNTTSTTKRK